MSDRVLGTIRSSWPIEQRAHELLARYLPMYLDEVARQASPDGSTFTPPARPTLIARSAPDRVDEADLPALVVSLEGTSGDVLYSASNGGFAAAWRLGLAAVTRDEADPGAARELAATVAAAAAALLVQSLSHPESAMTDARWTGETVADVAAEVDESTTQLRHVCRRTLEVDVHDVLNSFPTPPDPEDPTQDPGDLPTVESIELTVTPVEEIHP